jgi:hypothetical protein
MVRLTNKRRHWQNIVDKKCPDCGEKLQDHEKGYNCKPCSFFIAEAGMIKILTDGNHAAIKYLDTDRRERLEEELGMTGLEIRYDTPQNKWR